VENGGKLNKMRKNSLFKGFFEVLINFWQAI